MAIGFLKISLLGFMLLGAVSEARPNINPQLPRGRLHATTKQFVHKRATNNSTTACDSDARAPTVVAPHDNIWDTLTKDEVVGLLEWLHDPAHGLNLTTVDEAGSWDNTVGITELLMPNKTDALAYLDGNGPAPVRNARVGIFHGASDEPYAQAYMVGPLPVSNETTIEPLEYLYNKGDGRMPNVNADQIEGYGFYLSFLATLADITQDLLGVTIAGAENDTGLTAGLDILRREDDKFIDWIGIFVAPTNGFDDGTLLPAGMWLKFDMTGRDASQWSNIGVLYNDIFYDTAEEFRAAWEQPDFVKLTKARDGPFGWTSRQGDELPFDTLPAPNDVSPTKRYAIDEDNKYVKWMDFGFYLAFDRDVGLKFYDVKYKEERIIFELAMQEASAHYAGNDPIQSNTAYLDTYYGVGAAASSLVPGWDCPAFATYLDTVTHENSYSMPHPGSICIFEQDAGYPLARHTTYGYMTVTKNVQLVVRWLATVGNYDYLFDYVFSLDGTIEVKVRASGYIQAAYYAHNEDYGYHIHDALSGSMHDHVINWKVDFDVNGTANSLEKVEFVPHTDTYSWSKEPRNTMKIKRSFVGNEDEAKLNWGANSATSYVVVNKDSTNEFGEYRGYKISPNLGSPVYLTVQNSSNLQRNSAFAEHNLYAVRQKDTEPKSVSAWNTMDSSDPQVDFNKFFDGESLDQEDLVIYFNLGMHHVPHTGDLPNTVFTTAQAGIAISPHNYLLGDPSRQTSHSVHIDLSGETAEEEVYGGEEATCAYDMGQLYPDLSHMSKPEPLVKWPNVYAGGGA